MATVTGFTAERMLEIEESTVVNGNIVDDDLVLVRRDGGTINAGNVRGPQGIKGDTGDIPEAPADSKVYVRRNNAWLALSTDAPPTNGITYGLKDGVWTSVEVAVAPPNNSKRYAMRNGVWTLSTPPWTLEVTNFTDPLPAGFVLGAISAGNFKLAFSGSGYEVNYSLSFPLAPSSDVGALTRFTLPVSLRPVIETNMTGAMYANAGTSDWAGVTIGKIKTNGQINTDIVKQFSAYRTTPSVSVAKYSTLNVELIAYINGSFTRATDELPPSATYVP